MEKKRDILAWIRTVSIVGVFVIMLVCAMMIVPKVMSLTDEAMNIANRATTTLDEIDGAMGGLKTTADKISTEIPTMSGNVQATMKNVEKDLAGALKSIESVDFKKMNSAIEDLEAVVEPMAAFFGKK